MSCILVLDSALLIRVLILHEVLLASLRCRKKFPLVPLLKRKHRMVKLPLFLALAVMVTSVLIGGLIQTLLLSSGLVSLSPFPVIRVRIGAGALIAQLDHINTIATHDLVLGDSRAFNFFIIF